MGFVCFLPFLAVLLLFAVGIGIIAIGAIHQSRSMTLPQRLRLWAKLLGLALFVLGTFLWLVGHGISMSYGGYTYDGKIEDGRYYLEYKGDFIEVSKETWDYLETVESALGHRWMLLGALGMAAFVILGFCEKGRLVTTAAEAFDVTDRPT